MKKLLIIDFLLFIIIFAICKSISDTFYSGVIAMVIHKSIMGAIENFKN